MMEIAVIPEERRDPKNPAKYTVGPGPKLREALAKLPGELTFVTPNAEMPIPEARRCLMSVWVDSVEKGLAIFGEQ